VEQQIKSGGWFYLNTLLRSHFRFEARGVGEKEVLVRAENGSSPPKKTPPGFASSVSIRIVVMVIIVDMHRRLTETFDIGKRDISLTRTKES